MPSIDHTPMKGFRHSLRLLSSMVLILGGSAHSQWIQSSGPDGGYVYTLAVKGSYVFAGTHGAGAFRSSDDGATWTAANTGFSTPHVYGFLVSGTTLFAACPGGGGIYRSSDDGASWTPTNAGLTSYEVYSLAQVDTFLFAATMNGGGIFRSTDNGATWSWASSGLGNFSVWAIAAQGTNLFAGTYGGGAYRSTDNGANWTEADSGMTNMYVEAFTVTSAGIFAGTFGAGVFRSTDQGAHWSPVNGGLTDLYIRDLLAVGSDIVVANDAGVFRSTDDGANWQSINSGIVNRQARSLAVKGGWLFAGTNGGRFYRSSDGGTNWTIADSGLRNTSVVSFATMGADLFSGTDGAGVFRSPDNGKNWTAVNTGLTQTNIRAFANDGANLFAGTYGGVFRSTDNGANWSDVSSGMVYRFVLSLAMHGTSLFAGTSGGVQRSTDFGDHWTVINDGLTNPNVYALHVSGSNIFAGTSGGGVFVSTDDGSTWNPAINGLTNNVVFALASVKDSTGDTLLFAGTSGSGIFRSSDNGANWNAVNSGLGIHFIGTIQSSGSNLFAGGPVGGVFLSTDVGTSWNQVNTGLKSMSVNALAFGPNTALVPNIIAGTAYGSAWQRPLWQMVLSDVGYEVAKGWNIISVPIVAPDYRTSALFSTGVSSTFAYEGTYAVKDTLRPGVGYWLKFDHVHRIPLLGGTIAADTIDVQPGWNLIGSISTPLPVGDITSDSAGMVTSNFFGYRGSYFVTDSIKPAKGYWVKSSRAGRLFLSSSGLLGSTHRITIVPTADLPPTAPQAAAYEKGQPMTFSLSENYPNPFNPLTHIAYEVPVPAYITVAVYDVLGREVARLVDGSIEQGAHAVAWNAEAVPSGTYYCRFLATSSAGGVLYSETRKLLVIK